MRKDLVECPVCQDLFLPHSVYQHISQAAGKEAQYEMARLLYLEIDTANEDQDFTKSLIEVWVETVLENCPHWKYLLDNPKMVVNERPVEQKARWKKV